MFPPSDIGPDIGAFSSIGQTIAPGLSGTPYWKCNVHNAVFFSNQRSIGETWITYEVNNRKSATPAKGAEEAAKAFADFSKEDSRLVAKYAKESQRDHKDAKEKIMADQRKATRSGEDKESQKWFFF